jgi:ribonuclease J
VERIIFYDGVEEIGGTKILIELNKRYFFLDFGLNYKRRGLFFEEFLNPRVSNGIGDFFYLNLIPKIKGIYRKDLLEKLNEGGNNELGTGNEIPFVDAVFVTHAHFDHSGYTSFLRDDIPIFMSETTINLMKAMEESGVNNFETSIFKYIKRNLEYNPPKAERYGTHDVRKFDSPVDLGEVVIEPYSVDHSVPGAYGFVIKSLNATIAYSGDLRLHGKRASDTENFIKNAKNSCPDYLIIEGTNLKVKDKEEFWTEQRVFDEAEKVIKKAEKLIIADFSIRDIDRFLTFFDLAVRSERKLVITLRDAYLISAMNSMGFSIPDLNNPNIYFYFERRRSGTYSEKDYPEKWLKDITSKIDRNKLLKANEIHSNQGDFIVVLRFFDLQELIDLQPEIGSIYIHSSSEAHTEEQMVDEWRMDNWLKVFNLYPKIHLHASGHAKKEDLMRIVSEISPKFVLPVHTENPQEFLKYFPDKVKILKDTSEIILN